MHLFPILVEKSHFPTLRTFCPCWKLLDARCAIAGGYSCSKTKVWTCCSEFLTTFPKGAKWDESLQSSPYGEHTCSSNCPSVPACEPWKKPSWGSIEQLGLSQGWPWACHCTGEERAALSLSGPGQCSLEFGWLLGSISPDENPNCITMRRMNQWKGSSGTWGSTSAPETTIKAGQPKIYCQRRCQKG